MKKIIKVLGPGCPKCKTTYNNVPKDLKQTGIEAEVTKIGDMEEMMRHNVLTTPVLMIDGVADVNEKKQLLSH